MSDVVVEKRDEGGALVHGPGNRRTVSKDTLIEEYWEAATPEQRRIGPNWDLVVKWLNNNGWHVRPRTW